MYHAKYARTVFFYIQYVAVVLFKYSVHLYDPCFYYFQKPERVFSG